MVADFLAAESLLIDALVGIEGVRGVYGVGDADLSEIITSKLTPSLHVAYAGYRVAESHGAGPWGVIEQTWIVIAHTYHVADVLGGTGARSLAGPICSGVLSRLIGLKLGIGFGRLQLATPPREFQQIGRLLVPLAFTTKIAIDSDN